MTTLKKKYHELVSLTQLFLLREYSLKDTKFVNPNTFFFFQKKSNSLAPIQVKNFTNASLQQQNFQQSNQQIQIPTNAATSRPVEPRPKPPTTNPVPPLPKPVPPPAQPEPSSPEPQALINEKVIDKGGDYKTLKLEPLSPPGFVEHREFWNLFSNLFPHILLSKTIPTDTYAKKLKNRWLEEQTIPAVLILSFNDQEKHLSFLKNIAYAISMQLAPARVVSATKLEKEAGWESVLKSSALRLIITSDYELYLHSSLMKYYREQPQQGKHFLNHIPLLLLSDLSLYLKEPQLKALLWRAICNEFTDSKNSFSH